MCAMIAKRTKHLSLLHFGDGNMNLLHLYGNVNLLHLCASSETELVIMSCYSELTRHF